MSLVSNLGWVQTNILPSEILGRDVLDVGSRNWDLTIAEFVQSHRPKSYVGVDTMEGPGVTEVCKADDLVNRFGESAFDTIFCLEVMEHVQNWKDVINAMKSVLRPGGLLFLTTRTVGYEEHGYPDDFWRYDHGDLEQIFADFSILKLVQDMTNCGVYLKARKPRPVDLSPLTLYNIKTRSRG